MALSFEERIKPLTPCQSSSFIPAGTLQFARALSLPSVHSGVRLRPCGANPRPASLADPAHPAYQATSGGIWRSDVDARTARLVQPDEKSFVSLLVTDGEGELTCGGETVVVTVPEPAVRGTV